MDTHHFNIKIAELYGVDCAIMLQNLMFWIAKNKANNKHFYDGKYWTYNSVSAFKELFPYWSESQIRRILDKLESNGIISSGNYNKSSYDRTKWYCVNNQIHLTKLANGSDEIDKPIPDIKSDSKPNSKPNSKPKKPKFNFLSALISHGVEEQIAKDYMEVRKKKNASNTQTAFKAFLREANKAKHLSVPQVVQICAERSWKGFKLEWLDNLEVTKRKPSVIEQETEKIKKALKLSEGFE